MVRRLLLLGLVTVCAGCGHGPSAHRIRSDDNDRCYPQRGVHFVEHGRRGKGVLVAATPGFGSAFDASWTTTLVPVRPSGLEGPVWTGRSVGGDAAAAIARLPEYRSAPDLSHEGDRARYRFREVGAWVLGTDPFIVGLPAGAPVRTWREFALAETGVNTAPEVREPLDTWLARLVVDADLDQPLSRLVVYPSNFWEVSDANPVAQFEVMVVTLREPMRIADALDAIAAGDPARLGEVEAVQRLEDFASEREQSRADREDRERTRLP